MSILTWPETVLKARETFEKAEAKKKANLERQEFLASLRTDFRTDQDHANFSLVEHLTEDTLEERLQKAAEVGEIRLRIFQIPYRKVVANAMMEYLKKYFSHPHIDYVLSDTGDNPELAYVVMDFSKVFLYADPLRFLNK